MGSRIATIWVVLWTAAQWWACGSGEAPAGQEGGRCRSDFTCDMGLECLSNRCVRLGEDASGDNGPPDGRDPGGGDLSDLAGVDTGDGQDGQLPDLDGVQDHPDGCIADCSNRECGGDGCGGSCGTCKGADVCVEGVCLPGTYECRAGMCRVRAGTFWMGSNIDGTQCPGNALDVLGKWTEMPCHEVYVPEFWIDRTEVTVAEYQAYLDDRGPDCTNPGDGKSCSWPVAYLCNVGHPDRMQYPANCLTWFQADGYCQWAGKRLCSEAEWEKAARGTDGRLYPWGNEEADCTRAFVQERQDPNSWCGGPLPTWPVGSRPQAVSPYGCLDMAGNVFEWVMDLGHPNYNGAPVDGSAWTQDTPDNPWNWYGIMRGGSQLEPGYRARAAARATAVVHVGTLYDSVRQDYGVRCCRDTPPEEVVP